uniref:Obscurin, cytoskeletal calmodulin and titin-interacting RhoGEF n=1 Tax=Sphenodon punctatus TaxID=8508 RepID=A0A8D0G5B5_SPHPU
MVKSSRLYFFHQRYTEELLASEDPSQPPVLPLQHYLERHITRIQQYQTIIKELIRNKAKNIQNCALLEQAYAIVSALTRRAENHLHISLIEDYPGTLEILGEPIRQGQFIVWEGAPGARMAWKGHKRHVFLFRNYILVCKPKRDTKTDTYSYIFKNMMKLTNIDVNDLVEGDDRAFEIWYEREDSVRKYLFQARTVIIKNSWVKEICGIQQRISLPVWNPPNFEEELTDCTAELGETVKLACRVTGTPKPAVTWYKDGKPVEVDPHHIIIEDTDGSCTLILDNMTSVDSGQYMCYATSAAGNSSTLGKILVQVPPRFVNKVRNAYYVDGEDVQFTCTVEGAPSPQIRWYKEGELLADSSKHQIFSEPRSGVIVLVIKNPSKEDMGYYECEVSALTEQETKVPKKTIIIEETITTVVKSPRVKRRISPARPPSGYSSSRSPRSDLSTPEPVYISKVRQPGYRHEPEAARKTVIPTFFVTEHEDRQGATASKVEEQKHKWVEVEEIIEFNVKKPPKPTRKRGASPAKPERDESGVLTFTLHGSRPRRSSEDDPNTNNSNNKLVEQKADASKQDCPSSETADEKDDAAELDASWTAKEEALEMVQNEELPEDNIVIVDEPEELQPDDISSRDPKILTHDGKALTLEDLEDYVPQEGETYRCGDRSSTDDKPFEISVLQTEINEPTVGKPVLLNLGRPVIHQPRPSFFGKFDEHLPSGASGGPSFQVKPSFCTEVQRSADSGQSSFKTEVSTRTLSYSAIGEPVMLHISTEDPSQS